MRLSEDEHKAAGECSGAPLRDPFNVTWRERLLVLGTVYSAIIAAWIIGMVFARKETLELTYLIPAALFAVGKFLPLWSISNQSNFGAYELGTVIWVMDTVSVISLVYAVEALYPIDRCKRALDRLQTNAQLVLAAYPRMRRASMAGILAFVMFPVAGTGALLATFIGILLGMNRFLLIATVSAGGCLGGMLMAYGATHFGGALAKFQVMQREPALKFAILGGLVIVLAGCVWMLSRAYKRALAQARQSTHERL